MAVRFNFFFSFIFIMRFNLSNLILAHHIDNKKKKKRLGVKITYFGLPAQTRRIKDLQ